MRSGKTLFLSCVPTLLFAFSATLAPAQQYTSIVVFGDSLSDTGNDADLTQKAYGFRVPGVVADYTDGRFTDGKDTVPAARNYLGVWVEQLAALLPAKPAVKASLDGGTNYAYGFAKNGSGTGEFSFGTSPTYSVEVSNVGLQITTYLATHPRITSSTLFVVWGGANDVLEATSLETVADAALEDALNIQRLVNAGATQFLIPNLPPLGAIPRLNGSTATSVPANEATVLYNDTLAASLDLLPIVNFFRPLHIARLDVFHLFESVLAAPSTFSFANVTAMAQGNYLVNPDTYLFWDDLHPTTHGHNLLALDALKQVDPTLCRTLPGCAVLP